MKLVFVMGEFTFIRNLHISVKNCFESTVSVSLLIISAKRVHVTIKTD